MGFADRLKGMFSFRSKSMTENTVRPSVVFIRYSKINVK